jgi:hypothetical protein
MGRIVPWTDDRTVKDGWPPVVHVPRPRLTGLVAVVVIAAALGAGWSSGRVLEADSRPDLTAALDTLPVDVRTVGFTDWSAIRAGVGVGEASTRDLATRSVIQEQAGVLDDVLGWSLSDVDWEVYAQTNLADHATLRLSRAVSFADVRTKLRASGYTRDGRLWTLPEGELAGKGLTDLETVVALVPRKRLVVLTSAPAPARKVLRVIDGDTRSLAGVRAAAGTAQALAGNDTVLLQSGRDGCKDSAVANDPDAEQQARTAEARAGALRPYVYSGRALRDEGGAGGAGDRAVHRPPGPDLGDLARRGRARRGQHGADGVRPRPRHRRLHDRRGSRALRFLLISSSCTSTSPT